MTDNITLRRAAEYARVALDRLLYCEKSCNCFGRDAITALDAALAEPDAKREPATREQVAEAYKASESDGGNVIYCEAWRDAERFHGIRGSK
jgi:hypothetical protein